jgi:hypothetical protein
MVDSIEPGSTVLTDGYQGLDQKGYDRSLYRLLVE